MAFITTINMSRKLRSLTQKNLNNDIIRILAFVESSGKNELEIYEKDPIGFITEFLGEWLTNEQKAIAESILVNRHTNVQACHGVGKSWLSARIALWWVFAVRGMAITTAPTERQVEEILWGELRRLYDRHKDKLGGKRGRTFLRLDETAHAFGFTARADSPDAFQGIHHEKLLVIEDESSGISEQIDDGAVSCTTGGFNRLLRIGNPLSSNTPFHKACLRSHIRIPAWSHPNVGWAYEGGKLTEYAKQIVLDEFGQIRPQTEWPQELRDKIPGAVSITWIEEVRAKGEDSPFWLSRVEAQFPSNDSEGIIPRSWLEEARRRYDSSKDYWDNLAATQYWSIGADIGDGGDDHAIARWRGNVLYSVKLFPTKGDRQDVTRAAGLVIQEVKDLPGKYKINIDRTGVGSGTLAALLEQKIKASGCNFGEGSSKPEEFLNLKSELFWGIRDGLRLGEIAIAPLGRIEEMVFDDLSSIRYDVTAKGQIKCEEKAKTRQRLGRSPDAGDAVVIAWFKRKKFVADFSVG